ncbi:MAG: sulfatase family protein, partial [Planctomycetota bacterium]
YPPRQWAEKYPVYKMTLPEVGDISQYPQHIQRRIRNRAAMGEKRQRAHRAGYLGNLAFVDTCVGYVYDALENERLLDNTIVVYTADHGEMDGDHGLYQKFCLFEPSVRVPLIVSYPRYLPENKVTDALTEYIGLYPTLSELAGLEAPERITLHDISGAPRRMDAASFANVLRNPNLKGPSAAFSEYNLRSRICEYMIRTRRYKYIFNHGSTHELYDHEADPGEFVNRINDPAMKKVRDRLRDRLFAWYNPEKNSYRPT